MTATYKRPTRALRDGHEPAKTPDSGRADPDGHPEPDAGGRGPVLVCRVCRSTITRRDLAMEVNNSHRHVFFNPHGEVFELGCFASAKNVIPTGPKTDAFTWFPGHAWQAVACSGCATHLGWRFTGQGSGFFGLILAALAEDAAGKP
ncbi:MAG: hypothetical protein H0S80_14265 [Desulfovibrionaceae bacterium]|nr:hypothetical protein [Desulfovibrionaceae bacterium]